MIRLIAAALMLAGVARGSSPQEVLERAARVFEQGLSAKDPGQARDHFRDSAAMLEGLAAEQGIRNAALEGNIANAYLLAGDVGRAVLHYRRAERLDPRAPGVRAGLGEARKAVDAAIRPSPATRTKSFLYTLRSAVPSAVILGGFGAGYTASWLAIALLVTGWRGPRRIARALLVSGVPVATAGAGVLVLGIVLDRAASDAVVLTPTMAMKGPGTGIYLPAFEKPLPPGVEITVLEQRGEWQRIRLGDGREAWVSGVATERVVPRPIGAVSPPG